MRRFMFFLLMVVASASISAQSHGVKSGPAREHHQFDAKKFEADLEKFVISEAGITNLECTHFLPLYREKRKKEVQTMQALRNHRNGKPTTEREWEEAMKAHDNMELQLKKIQQTYHNRMVRIIPASKVVKVIFAEEKYHREAFGKKHDRERNHGTGHLQHVKRNGTHNKDNKQ